MSERDQPLYDEPTVAIFIAVPHICSMCGVRLGGDYATLIAHFSATETRECVVCNACADRAEEAASELGIPWAEEQSVTVEPPPVRPDE